jgi:hypothetical protein
MKKTVLEKCAEERKVEKERFPCPGAIELNCNTLFANRYHLQIAHFFNALFANSKLFSNGTSHLLITKN